MKPLKDTTIIICGIVRDASRGLQRNIPVIDALCREMKDFRIVIYENDSKDNTKEQLRTWHDSDPVRIHTIMADTDPTKTIPSARAVKGNPFFSHKRIDKMARLRNEYMEYVDEQGWTADYLMVVDMDVAQLYIGGILDSLRSEKEWDAVVANGYSTSPKLRRRYHDTYALTLWEDRNQPQTEAKIKELADRFGSLRRGDEWVRIASGFGGLAIYRFEAVKGLRYSAMENDDDRVEVRCEHYSIYDQMMSRGYDRFYINPSMEIHYQRLTWRIIWNSLKRKIQRR